MWEREKLKMAILCSWNEDEMLGEMKLKMLHNFSKTALSIIKFQIRSFYDLYIRKVMMLWFGQFNM